MCNARCFTLNFFRRRIDGSVLFVFIITLLTANCNSTSKKPINNRDSISWINQRVHKAEFMAADSLKLAFDTSVLPNQLYLKQKQLNLIPFVSSKMPDIKYDSTEIAYLVYGFQNNRQILAISEETPSWSFHYLYHTNNGVIDSIIGKPKFYKNRIISFLDWVTDCNHEISIWNYSENRLKQIISFDWQREVDPNGTQWLLDVAYVNDSTFITKSHTRDNHYTDTLYYRFTRNRLQ